MKLTLLLAFLLAYILTHQPTDAERYRRVLELERKVTAHLERGKILVKEMP